MTPLAFTADIMDPGLELLAELGGPQVSDEARRFLLAVALQENGPNLAARYQNHPSATPGPARGWWQFEQGGGVTGVLNHSASRDLARKACTACHVADHPAAVWRALEGHDLLAAMFARLLLWTDAHPVPQDEASAWTCYADRLWRPGKPHFAVWPGNWQTAFTTIYGGQ